MKIYAASIIGMKKIHQDGSYQLIANSYPLVFLAENEDEATGIAYKKAMEKLSNQDGYSDQKCSVVQVPDYMIEMVNDAD